MSLTCLLPFLQRPMLLRTPSSPTPSPCSPLHWWETTTQPVLLLLILILLFLQRPMLLRTTLSPTPSPCSPLHWWETAAHPILLLTIILHSLLVQSQRRRLQRTSSSSLPLSFHLYAVFHLHSWHFHHCSFFLLGLSVQRRLCHEDTRRRLSSHEAATYSLSSPSCYFFLASSMIMDKCSLLMPISSEEATNALITFVNSNCCYSKKPLSHMTYNNVHFFRSLISIHSLSLLCPTPSPGRIS